MNQSNCMVAQSGGPTAAINASLAGVISGIKKVRQVRHLLRGNQWNPRYFK